MATPSYAWNPFQDITSNDIKNELVTSQGGDRAVIIPRAAPFFAKNVVVRNAANNNVLTFGVDYTFCYPFNDFNRAKSQLAYGGILLVGNTGVNQLSIDYSTLGGAFVLDDGSYAQSLANISNRPRSAEWRDVTNLPMDGFPPDPHDHPLSQTYNYDSMMTMFTSLVNTMNNETNNPTVQSQLAVHSGQTLAQAHGGGTPKDVGLNNVQNYPAATENDLVGGSNERMMSVAMSRLLFNLMFKQAMGDYDPTDLPIQQLESKLDQIVDSAISDNNTSINKAISDAINNFSNKNPIINVSSTGFTGNTAIPVDTRNFTPNTTPSVINLGNNLVMILGEGVATTSATPTPATLNQPNVAYLYEGTYTLNYPRNFAVRPFCFASPYDANGASGEFAFPAIGDNKSVSIRVGCNMANLPVPFAYLLIGVVTN